MEGKADICYIACNFCKYHSSKFEKKIKASTYVANVEELVSNILNVEVTHMAILCDRTSIHVEAREAKLNTEVSKSIV